MYETHCSRIKKWIAQYLLGISFLATPLYIRDGYLGLTGEKAGLYLQLTAPALFFAAMISIIPFLTPKADPSGVSWIPSARERLEEIYLSSKTPPAPAAETDPGRRKQGLSAFSDRIRKAGIPLPFLTHGRLRHFYTLWAAAAWGLVSAFLSPDRKSSLCGTLGWSMGALMLCALILSTLCIAAWLPSSPGPDPAAAAGPVSDSGSSGDDRINSGNAGCERAGCGGPGLPDPPPLPVWFFAAMYAVHAAIMAFAILQAAGMDLFGFLSVIDRHYAYSYLSTIGQKNCFSGYLCLMLPLFWGAFLESRKKLLPALLFLINAAGLFCAAISDSDSIYAGFGISLLFLLTYAFSSGQRARRSSLLLTLFGVCLLAARSLPVFADRVSHMEGISSLMLRLPSACSVILAGLLLSVYSAKYEFFFEKGYLKVLLLALRTAVAAGIACGFIWCAANFSDSFGTNRGLIWRTGWEQFLKAPLLQKITGIGPGMLSLLYANLRISHGINVSSAHCEPLHILLTMGITGFCLYLLFWWNFFSLWKRKKTLREGKKSIFFISLAAFWGQSLFCPLYPLTAVLLSAIAGLCISLAEQ